jgi:hypothetical protein
MTVIVSFDDYTPVARYDSVPWASATIEEATAIDGAWTPIDTVTLTPADPDPAHPVSRSFTTGLGTAADLWYRVKFVDGNGDESLPTIPLQNVNVTRTPYATTSELAMILHITEAPNVNALNRVLAAAAAEIDAEIGLDAPYSDPPALVVEVNLERAVEHWQQMKSPFGIIGLGSEAGGMFAATDSWNRHANKLAPLKASWGIA